MIFSRDIFSSFLIIFLFFILSFSGARTGLVFDVQKYGAISNGVSDSTAAFQGAWAAACACREAATIYVPQGRYLLRNVEFEGQSCKNGAITINIKGTLLAPSDYNVVGNSGTWLKFEGVNGVSIYGGTINAQGTQLWAAKNSSRKCPLGSTSLAFYNSRNIIIDGLTSLDSQMFHIAIYDCRNATLQGLKIIAPGDSPNTDGIHVQLSSNVTISRTHISTGDDCISLGPGSSNIWISTIVCGPGHGISIGSLGNQFHEPGVENVIVKYVKFLGTTNGLRVKTWARPSNGFVWNVHYQHVTMVNVENPILIDQNYCPHLNNCPTQGSGVRIKGITYEDINGTSTTQATINLSCSKIRPCTSINLENINLTYNNNAASASCVNVQGEVYGIVKPSGCLK